MYFERHFKNAFLQELIIREWNIVLNVSGEYEFDKIYNFMEQSICEIIENRNALPFAI